MTNTKSIKRALVSSILVLCLCCTMLVGTTFAWFTDSVTSSNNVIKTGKLDVGFYWVEGKEDPATTTAWKDASEGAIFDYAKWEPGYAEARHLKVTNEGTLALNYQMRIVANGVVTKLADVIEVYYINEDAALTDRAVLANAEYLGTLTEILGTGKHLSKKVFGSMVEGAEPDVHTLVLKMSEKADNEYMDMDLGCTFSVELIASQMASESDSFDNLYDGEGANIPDPAVPAALVRPLEGEELNINATAGVGGTATNIILDAGYRFQPTDDTSLDDNGAHPENSVYYSEYKQYHADFYVYADREVPADSIALAGYYDAWCQYNDDNWVALVNEGEAIAANQGIRLVELLGACVTYKDICDYANDGIGFLCGLADLSDGLNAGTTITVELRLYETENADSSSHTCSETGAENYITIGKFTHTFAGVEVEDQAALEETIAEGVKSVELNEGTYNINGINFAGKEMTFSGTKDTVIDATATSVNNQFVTGADMVFDGVTVNFGTDNYYGFANTDNLVFRGCTINGYQYLYGKNVVFEDCVFNSTGYAACIYAADNVSFIGCEFNTAGKALLLYKDDLVDKVYNVVVKDCTFNASASAYASAITNQACAAIEIHNFGASYKLITSGNTIDPDFSGEWRIKVFESTKGTTVTVNGTAYTTTALDGTAFTVVNKEVQ